MKHIILGTIKFFSKLFFFCFLGGFLVILTAFIFYLHNQADLKPWHQVQLNQEFTLNSSVKTFSQYLELEDRLFKQMDKLIYQNTDESQQSQINRYSSGSKSDPNQWKTNWNRSFVLTHDEPKAGVLLIHGMSDSPYLMRNLAEKIHSSGATVIALRLPGHGTIPSGLVNVQWQDMAKAVRMAVIQLKNLTGKKPLYLTGFSTGGALSVNYILQSIPLPSLPKIDGVVLISPAIGLGPEAALAIWQDRLGRWLGLDKLAWNAVLPEYDPFKYNSFAINAGDLVYQLTLEIQHQLDSLDPDQLLQIPPILAFQSLVDATVSTPELVAGLFNRLKVGDHELMIFNINRKLEVEYLLKNDPGEDLRQLLSNENLPFAVSVLTNKNRDTMDVVVRSKPANSGVISEHETDLAWPRGIFSLSHVALPIPIEDPLYGGHRKPGSKDLHLGVLALRGEKGILQLSGNEMMRMRWNPFYPLMEQKILSFMELNLEKTKPSENQEIPVHQEKVKSLI